MAETEEREETWAALRRGITIGTDVEITCTAKTAKTAKLLEVPDMAFHHGSAVVLPSVPPAQAAQAAQVTDFANTELGQALESDQKALSERLKAPFRAPDLGPAREPGLPLILATYQLLEDNPDLQLVVAGHADTTGSKAVNRRISEARARAVVAVLEGDRDDWLAAVKDWSVEDDARVILGWAASARGWPCHPAQCKDLGAAVRELQAAYNRDFEQRIAVDGIVGPQTRGAWFDLYQRFLEERAGGADALASLRGQLRWASADVKALACGEDYPLERPGQDGYRSRLNRRVEVLLFASADVPDLAQDDPAAEVYSGDYTFEPVEPTVRPSEGQAETPPEPALEPVDDAPPAEDMVTTMPVRPVDATDPYGFLDAFDQAFPRHGRSRQARPDDEAS